MKHLLAAFLLAFACLSCAKRLPPPQRTEKIISQFFDRYAKKYPATSFGQHHVKNVEVLNQTEIRKNLAAVEAYITLENGEVKKIFATVEKKSLRWKFISWENPEGS